MRPVTRVVGHDFDYLVYEALGSLGKRIRILIQMASLARFFSLCSNLSDTILLIRVCVCFWRSKRGASTAGKNHNSSIALCVHKHKEKRRDLRTSLGFAVCMCVRECVYLRKHEGYVSPSAESFVLVFGTPTDPKHIF